MNLNFQQLQAMGAFVTQAIFTRDITITSRPMKPQDTWEEPDVPEYEDEEATCTFTAHIRKRNSADFLKILRASEDERPHMKVLLCVVDEAGKPLFKDWDAVCQLNEAWAIELAAAVDEVNRYDAKKSTPRMSGGAISPSPSAGPSRSARPASRKKSAASG